VFIVVTLVVLGLLVALVAWRRRVAARWQPDRARALDGGTPFCTRVWVQKARPRRSMFAARDRVTGELCVDAAARVATFRVPDGQQVRFTRARSVTVGARGSDFVNTWVEVDCDVDGQRMVVYLNDAAWLGWRALLTGANTRLADAVAQIREPGVERP
jgi:hypothetical protein